MEVSVPRSDCVPTCTCVRLSTDIVANIARNVAGFLRRNQFVACVMSDELTLMDRQPLGLGNRRKGSLLGRGRIFEEGGGFGGGYGRVCEMICPHLSGPLPESLKFFREFSEQNRNHQKFFARFFVIKVKVR